MEEDKHQAVSKEQLLRQQILAIQRDETLDARQKAERVQNLMSSAWKKSQENVPKPATPDEMAVSYFDETNGVLGCKHYRVDCKIKADCCKKFFVCRVCHDELSDHNINRYATQEMLCMRCQTVQPVSQFCNSEKCAGMKVSHYYCEHCKFHDNDPAKNIYHCPDCKICRIGKGIGIDRFHCTTCDTCMSIEARDHKCIPDSMKSNCPICGQYLFSSRDPVTFMKCGHPIHSTCFSRYLRMNWTCPICHKALRDMTDYYNELGFLIQLNRMPEEYAASTALISCNDCEQRSTVPYHFIGHKCGNSTCGSYNTVILKTENMPSYHVPEGEGGAAAGGVEYEVGDDDEDEDMVQGEDEAGEEEDEEGLAGEEKKESATERNTREREGESESGGVEGAMEKKEGPDTK